MLLETTMRRIKENRIVLASHNKGKLKEIYELFDPFKIQTLPISHFSDNEPKETEDTFIGNARIKAHYAAQHSNLLSLSDDSGIMIDALNGAPGVYTADWAETESGRDFNRAMTKVWKLLDSIKAPKPIKAKFICVLCLAWPDGHDETFEGTISGQISWPMRGKNGFGFDPIFIPDGYEITFAEMEPEKKHKINHRHNAFRKLIDACLS